MVAAAVRNAQRTKDTQHYFEPRDFFPDLPAPAEADPQMLSAEDLLKKMETAFPPNQ